MSKKTRCRVLSLLLALVMVLGMVPMASASSAYNVKLTPTTPDASKLSTAIQQNKFKLQNGEEAYADNDTVRAIVIFEGEGAVPAALKSTGVATQRAVAAASKTLTAQHSRIKTAIQSKAVSYDVKYEYTTLLNGMSADVKFGDLEKLASTAGVKEVYLANYYDEPVVMPSMDSANDMTNITKVRGYDTGKGTVIAVIDTGITPGHEAFTAYDSMLNKAAISKEQAEAAIEKLGRGKYLSAKVPFSYDYYDKDNDATDDVSGHGTHVSGIAAGCVLSDDGGYEFAGSAPGAQILAMKVFSSDPAERGTSSDVYLAALEDAYTLGADVINMSLGAQNGFVYDGSEEKVLNGIFTTLDDAGVICCIAAGNEGSMADGESITGVPAGYVTSDYADYGVVGSPSTYDGNLSVASVDNAKYASPAIEVDGAQIGYSDTVNAYNTLAGKTYDFVLVPGNGEEADYDGINVTGKVAVIKRGGISFVDKVNNADAKGAVAAIVYNNESGIINMALDGTKLPAVSVSGEDAAKLLNAKVQKVTFLAEMASVDNPTGWQSSSFSSWGPTPSLTLKPQISGVGGSVLSAQNDTTDGYQVMSGLLESYGGHELAAGFTIRRESIAPFREKMMALCASFRESDACSTALAIDCEIPPELLTIENIQALGDLEPCGAGCPRPVLCMRGLHVTELAEVGGGKHLRLRLSKGTHTWGAIFFSTNAQRAAVAQGDVVDIAFTPQINEYRSVRSVQLNLVDIRPDKAFREAQGHDRAVYKKHLAGGALSCDEAGCLLPTRQDFAAVWRYLAAFSQDGVLSEELGCLSRKISRCAKLPLSAGKTRICLDVLAEQGLLQLEQRPKSLCIRLCANGRKVDLEKSPILIHLKKQKAGN